MGDIITKPHFPFYDLLDCDYKSCNDGEFLCSINKYCISIRLVCDGLNHCSDGEDEAFCRLLSTVFL